MRFRSNLKALVINPKQESVIDAWARENIEEAARIWIRAALDIIPAWSGASRATLQALASAVGEHVSIDVSSTAPDRVGLGRLLSSGGVRKNGPGDYEFFYETRLEYLLINETQRVAPRTHGLRGALIHPTPYQFREAGNRAVRDFISKLKFPLLPLESKKI